MYTYMHEMEKNLKCYFSMQRLKVIFLKYIMEQLLIIHFNFLPCFPVCFHVLQRACVS